MSEPAADHSGTDAASSGAGGIESATHLAAVLSDVIRLRILCELTQSPLSARQVASALDLPQPTVSHHLSVLVQVELVTRHVIGNTPVYALGPRAAAECGALVVVAGPLGLQLRVPPTDEPPGSTATATPRVLTSPHRPLRLRPVAGEKHDPYAGLKFHVDDEHRIVVVGTPDGLDAMTDAQIVALWRRASQRCAEYKAAGYTVAWEAEDPRWQSAALSHFK